MTALQTRQGIVHLETAAFSDTVKLRFLIPLARHWVLFTRSPLTVHTSLRQSRIRRIWPDFCILKISHWNLNLERKLLENSVGNFIQCELELLNLRHKGTGTEPKSETSETLVKAHILRRRRFVFQLRVVAAAYEAIVCQRVRFSQWRKWEFDRNYDVGPSWDGKLLLKNPV